jgi:lambda repressor-like predicted transcriptional regulator
MLDTKHKSSDTRGMNKLPLETRVQILSMLCEGSSMRSISRITGVSINTVSKLLIDAGLACAAFHDKTVRGITAKSIQADEIWSFSYAKQKNVKFAKTAPEGAGDVWTWTGIEADTKLIVSWHVGDRSQHTGIAFIGDLKGPSCQPRPAHHGRPQGLFDRRQRGRPRGRLRDAD